MKDILSRLRAVGVTPVAALPEVEHAEPMAEALMRGGLPVAEVTFRTDAAAESIGRIRKAQPDMLVGAGTVLTTQQADAALEAGAEFIVAPGFDPVLVDYCLGRNVPVIPGVCTASELTQAVLRELPAVKFFPAQSMGGVSTLKSLAAPFPPMEFMVTGGVSQENMASWLAWEPVMTVGGSWMVKKSLLADKDYDRVAELAAEAVRLAREARSNR